MTHKKEVQNDIIGAFLDLAEASMLADFTKVRRVGSKVANMLSANGNIEAAKQLRSILRKKSVPLRSSGYSESLPVDGKSRMPLVEELIWPEVPLFLSKDNHEMFFRFITDIKNTNKLSKLGLSSMPRLLLSGPPGTGKTLMAGHIAANLSLPLYVVRLDSLISSFLGETAKNIRAIFEFITMHKGVLLLDEIDAVAKMRDDKQELGELKRVVNTLIQGLDSLDEYPAVIGATNHEELLDAAIWRRFPYRTTLSLPDEEVRFSLWKYYLFEDNYNEFNQLLSVISDGMSCSDIMEAAYAERRRGALEDTPIDISKVVISVISNLNGSRKSFIIPDKISKIEKHKLIHYLNDLNLKKQDIATLLNTSRQTVHNILRSEPYES